MAFAMEVERVANSQRARNLAMHHSKYGNTMDDQSYPRDIVKNYNVSVGRGDRENQYRGSRND